MHDTVVIVTGSEPLDAAALATIPSDAVVIAADGGLDHALAAGLSPTIVVGDLDSVGEDALAWAREHADVRTHPVDKDLTDTELAVALAADLHPERLVLVAGGGDRLDHTLAAIGALGAPVTTGIPDVELHWAGQWARVFHAPARSVLRFDVGSRLSALALHGPCHGVTVTGTRWELHEATLEPLVGHGVSNEVVTRDVRVEVHDGVLTVFVAPPPDRDPSTPSVAVGNDGPTDVPHEEPPT